MIFSALMGMVQGLSEFLPISSSGHLLVAEKLLSLLGYQSGESAVALTVMLHMGTLASVAIIFWKDWMDMLRHPLKNPLLKLLFIASLPALGFKILLGKGLDSLFEGWFLGISFVVTGLFLCLIEFISRKRPGKAQEITIPRALTMGVFQGIAILPGVSRSGSTLLGGLFSGLDRKSAIKFSFMMSAPAILGGFVVEGKEAVERYGLGSLLSLDILIGVLTAAVVGYFVIRYMLKLIERISFYHFAIYVFILAALVIFFQVKGIAGFPPIALPQGFIN